MTNSICFFYTCLLFWKINLFLPLSFCLFGNRLFCFQAKYCASIKRNTEFNKRSPQFLYCHYICKYVSVIATAYTIWTSKMELELGRLQSILLKCIYFHFLKFLSFMEFCPFFHLPPFPLNIGYWMVNHDNQYIKLKLWTYRNTVHNCNVVTQTRHIHINVLLKCQILVPLWKGSLGIS